MGHHRPAAVRRLSVIAAPTRTRRRLPWLTAAVTLVTAAGLAVQETVPGTLERLQRSPAATHGEWWRWITALVTQDGHVAGGLFNLVGLVLCGLAAEWTLTRTVWLTAYLGAGLVGQVFGHFWQPVGAGNSVAVCGLAAVLTVVGVLRRDRYAALPRLARLAPVVWVGCLAGSISALVIWPLVVVGGLLGGPLADRRWAPWLATVLVTAGALALLVAQDLHGGALTTALLVGAAVALTRPALLADT